jgi:hypothetical protein
MDTKKEAERGSHLEALENDTSKTRLGRFYEIFYGVPKTLNNSAYKIKSDCCKFPIRQLGLMRRFNGGIRVLKPRRKGKY